VASTVTEGSVHVDGRLIAYAECGDATGPLVLHHHGGPSSRLEAELFAPAATRLGLHLVCPDRPGIGRSDPQPDRTFASSADDLTALADAFGAGRFAVTGWSEGGPWALAAAAYLDPDRLVHVTSIAGAAYGAFGPNWAAPHLGATDALGGRLALHFRPGFTLLYDLLGMTVTHFEASYATSVEKAVGEADREVLRDEGVRTAFLRASHECFRQGAHGLIVDAENLYKAWPFDVTAVERPVHVWQGDQDALVPPVISQTVADRMPGALWHPVAGGGHFIAVSHADHILGQAAADLRGAR
jgi:pimeloyl-ACP methyl ester carboxylesterase